MPSSITHVLPAVAERGAREVRLHRFARVGERLGDDDALARGEPVGLDDVEAGQRLEERERVRLLARVEGRVPGRRHARSHEHVLHPGLGAFELRGRGRTPEHEPPGRRAADRRHPRRAVLRARPRRDRDRRDRRARRPRPGSLAATGMHSPSSAMPGLPGAEITSSTAAERVRPQPSACSRPPEPTRSTRAIRRRGEGRRSDRVPGRRRRTKPARRRTPRRSARSRALPRAALRAGRRASMSVSQPGSVS